MGLFSLLDALLDQQMNDLMEKVPLGDELKLALCGMQNNLLTYLALARAFENGDWDKVKLLSKKVELDQRTLHSFYNESIKWGKAMTLSIKA